MNKLIILVIILAVIIGVLYWATEGKIFAGLEELAQRTPGEQIVITYWGIWDDKEVLKPLIEAYQKDHPEIRIDFVKQSILNYRTRLQTQIRQGEGPDIYEIHGSWIGMFASDLAITTDINTEDFYPITKLELVGGNNLYAAPLELDGLVLFYNEDILKAANVSPPSSWYDFVESAKKMTVKNEVGAIQTAGAALGTSTNVDYWSEIIGLLFYQQPEGDPKTPANKDGIEVMQFYTSFITDPKSKTWDINLSSSTQMFVQGRLAFYFAPLRKATEIKRLNSNLKFKTAPVPQLPGRQIAWSSYWVKGVSNYSQKKTQAWEFLSYLSSESALKSINEQKVKQKIQPLAYPKVSMKEGIKADPLLGAVVSQGDYYKSWYLNSDTLDAGMNDEIIKHFKFAVDQTLQGEDPQEALEKTQKGVNEVYIKYGFSNAPPEE